MQPYIIGETAYNHEGDFKYLKQMIDDIAEIGLDAVKFHLLLNPLSYMQKDHPLFSTIKTWVFSKSQWDELIEYSNKKKLDIIALCDDFESIEYLLSNKKQIKAIEIHSVSLNDFFLLKAVSEFNGMIILGIGGSTLDEVQYSIDLLKSQNNTNILLMYGFQNYPTDYKNINFYKMLKIKNLFRLEVAYADHTAFDDPNNEIISSYPASMGINILEKHYTPDYGKKRIDYHAAVGKNKMKRIKELMSIALAAYGTGKLNLTIPELNYRNIGPMKKAIVAKNAIAKGEIITLDKLWYKRTKDSTNMMQNQLQSLLNQKAKIDIKKDEIIDFSKVDYVFNKDLE